MAESGGERHLGWAAADRRKGDVRSGRGPRLAGRSAGSPSPGRFDRNGPGRDRTCDLRIKSPLLYQLSYRPTYRAIEADALGQEPDVPAGIASTGVSAFAPAPS